MNRLERAIMMVEDVVKGTDVEFDFDTIIEQMKVLERRVEKLRGIVEQANDVMSDIESMITSFDTDED